ncbi:MAG: MFS transporter [Oscillospiraceae bacterium]|nr:MFS transporter [Oscillospiraceae bacterium]
MKPKALLAYSLGHFWVDFSCALLMFSLSGQGDWALCVLLYNFSAFALQMPIGLLADQWNRNSRTAALGCGLAALGWALSPIPVAAALSAGLGNACFHVGGGIQVLEDGGDRAAPLGVFVSPGAFGIFFGTLLGRSSGFSGLAAAAGLLGFALGFCLLESRGEGKPAPSARDLNRNVLWALACCFLVVVLRSYLGMILSFPWKTGAWSLWVICAVVSGKAAGGFLGDRLGMLPASVLSLGLSTVLFCLSGFPLAGTAAVFFFNMTMPITLWAAAQLLPDRKGFAFGMLTFALFLGFLPVWLGWPPLLHGGSGYAVGALCSLALLVLGLKRGRF